MYAYCVECFAHVECYCNCTFFRFLFLVAVFVEECAVILVVYPLLWRMLEGPIPVCIPCVYLCFSPRVYLYTCHDSTIVPLLKSLGIFDGAWPPYCSSVEFDLFENQSVEKFVTVSYCGKVSWEEDVGDWVQRGSFINP